jgi:hypothetical protein
MARSISDRVRKTPARPGKTGDEKFFSSGYSHISTDVLKSIIRVRPGGDFTGPTRFPFAGTRKEAGG